MSQRHITCLKPGKRHGFTLIELIIAVAVVGVLAAIAAPGMAALVDNGRITGQAEEVVTSLQLARAEAVRRGARVTMCAGSNGTCSGSTAWSDWTVFGVDKTAATATTDVIRDSTASGSVQISGPAAGIVFKPSGLIDSSQQLEITMSGYKRCLTVLISGVVSVKKVACS